MPPQFVNVKEDSCGFMNVTDNEYCGERGALLSTEVNDTGAFSAQRAGAQSFLLAIWCRRGYSYAGVMEVSEPDWMPPWMQNRMPF